MTNAKSVQLKKIKQLIWDGRITVRNFDLYSPAGRDAAAEYLLKMLDPKITLEEVQRGDNPG